MITTIPLTGFPVAFAPDLSNLQGQPNTMWEPIVRRARRGDPEAREEICQSHYLRVYRLASRLTDSVDDAVEITQETFARAFERLSELRTPAALSWWLKSIATNLCHDRHRRDQKLTVVPFTRESWDDKDGLDEWEPSDESFAPESRVLQAEVQDRVRQAVQTLPREQQQVVVLHHLEGMRVEEIAASVGCAVGTVKSRLARGRARLFETLQPFAAAA